MKRGFRSCKYWIYLGIYTKMVSSFLFFVSTVPGLCCASGCLSSSGGQWLTYQSIRNKPVTKDNVPLLPTPNHNGSEKLAIRLRFQVSLSSFVQQGRVREKRTLGKGCWPFPVYSRELVGVCLVPRPQYSARPMHFGSRGPSVTKMHWQRMPGKTPYRVLERLVFYRIGVITVEPAVQWSSV